MICLRRVREVGGRRVFCSDFTNGISNQSTATKICGGSGFGAARLRRFAAAGTLRGRFRVETRRIDTANGSNALGEAAWMQLLIKCVGGLGLKYVHPGRAGQGGVLLVAHRVWGRSTGWCTQSLAGAWSVRAEEFGEPAGSCLGQARDPCWTGKQAALQTQIVRKLMMFMGPSAGNFGESE